MFIKALTALLRLKSITVDFAKVRMESYETVCEAVEMFDPYATWQSLRRVSGEYTAKSFAILTTSEIIPPL